MRREVLAGVLGVLLLAAPVQAAGVQHPGTEAMLRARLAELVEGRLKMETLSEEIAAVARTEQPHIQQQLRALGPLKSVTFRDVDKLGSDVYDVRFEHGAQTWVVKLGPDGRAVVLLFEPA